MQAYLQRRKKVCDERIKPAAGTAMSSTSRQKSQPLLLMQAVQVQGVAKMWFKLWPVVPLQLWPPYQQCSSRLHSCRW